MGMYPVSDYLLGNPVIGEAWGSFGTPSSDCFFFNMAQNPFKMTK